MRVAWLPVAKRDRDGQLAFIRERNPWAAIDLGDAIAAAVRHLQDHPNIGRPGRVRGTRELAVGGTPYVLAYRLRPDALLILRMLHGAQRWPTSL